MYLIKFRILVAIFTILLEKYSYQFDFGYNSIHIKILNQLASFKFSLDEIHTVNCSIIIIHSKIYETASGPVFILLWSPRVAK